MTFECQYCLKTFKREATYLAHSCSQMEKFKTLQQPVGQSAYAYYCQWMTEYKRKAPAIETFGDSRYFKSFVEFAKFTVELRIPNPAFFVRLMCEKDVSPYLWTKSDCYQLYLECIDNIDPMEMVRVTIETLMNEQYEKGRQDLTETLGRMDINTMVHLLKLRQLSPWVLLCSGTFKEYLLQLSDDERKLLMRVIVPEYWGKKLNDNPSVVKEIKGIVDELGLNKKNTEQPGLIKNVSA